MKSGESEKVNTMLEKKVKAKAAYIRQLMFISPSDLAKYRSGIINDIANSIAENYEEYMELWCSLMNEKEWFDA